MNGFLRGIRPGHFLDTVAEWHALVEGFSEVLCPWPPRHKAIDPELLSEIASEYHYYMWGRALGILAWATICCVITSAIKGVIHG